MLKARDEWRRMETNGKPFVSHLLLDLETTNGWMSRRHPFVVASKCRH